MGKIILRIRFYDDTQKGFINEWTLCKADVGISLFTLYDKIYNGEITFDLKSSLENYDVDKLWAESTSTNKNIPVLNQLVRTPLEFCISDVIEDHRKIFIIFHLSQYSPSTSGCPISELEEVESVDISSNDNDPQKSAFELLMSASRQPCVPPLKIGKKTRYFAIQYYYRISENT